MSNKRGRYPVMPGPNNQNFFSRGRSGGGSRGSNHRRKRGNPAAKITQNRYDDDEEFQKLPSDTAPAYRFVEKKRKLRGNPRATVGSDQTLDRTDSTSYQQENVSPGRKQLSDIQEDGVIIPTEEHSNITPIDEIETAIDITSMTSHLQQSSLKSSSDDDDEDDYEDETLDIALQQQRVTLPIAKFQKSNPIPFTIPKAEHAVPSVSIRGFVGCEDISETELTKAPCCPPGLPIPTTPLKESSFLATSSPLIIKQTPIHTHLPQQASLRRDIDPYEQFLKLVDVETRYLNEKLEEYSYNPDLAFRLRSDFQIIDSAYERLALTQMVTLSPFRLLYNSLLTLKKATEQRNHDVKVLGALKTMAQTYDKIRTVAAHDKWLRGDKPLSLDDIHELDRVARGGEHLMETLRWNIKGGDSHLGHEMQQGHGRPTEPTS